MDGLRLKASAFGQSLCGATSRGTKLNRYGLGEQNLSSEFTSVVLPTPGPPVITVTLARSATRTAAFWLSASVSFVRFSTQGIALSTSITGQGGFAAASVSSVCAI